MRIISNNIDFDLPEKFAAEFTRNNVMLTDAGEQTSPITLPGTAKNLKLVQNSDRLDNYYKPLTDLTVTVIDGLMNRQCNMGIHTANEVDGISCTLYFDTGGFYSRVYDRKLASLDWEIIEPGIYINQHTHTTYLDNNELDTPDNRVKWCINKLKYQYLHPSSSDWFKVFTLLTSKEYTWKFNRIVSITPGTEETVQKYDEYGNALGSWNELGEWIPETETIITDSVTTTEVQTKTAKFQINGFETEVFDVLELWDFRRNNVVKLKIFQGEKVQKVWADSTTEIALPLGYGMTPFLTIKFILEKIFEGYTLDTSAISAKMTGYASFTNDVLINTVADAICPGRINPAQLVPDVTVKDFVAFCEKRYAGKFIVDEVRSKVTFVNNNVVSSVPDMDISAYLSAYPKQGAIEFEKIIVKYNTDVVADTNDSKLKTSTIDFDFYTLVDSKINKAFSNVGQTIFQYVDLTLYLLDIGEIINKNSTLIVDGKTVVEKPTTPTEIKIVSFDDFTNSYFKCMSLSPVGYVTAVRRTLPLNLIPQHPDVKSFYSIFSAFKLNSNIPITAEMNIPAPIMEQLKLHTPKLLNGQSILIESIKYALGKRGTQTVTMRTLRNYADRDPL